MFNKLKEKLKRKLIKWLEIDRVERELSRTIKIKDKNSQDRDSNIKQMVSNNNVRTRRSLLIQDELIETLHKTVQNVVAIGTDVNHPESRSGSWCVICIEGQYNVVKFVDLHDRKTAMHILEVLKEFEGGRHTIDSPHKDLFFDYFLFNENKRS